MSWTLVSLLPEPVPVRGGSIVIVVRKGKAYHTPSVILSRSIWSCGVSESSAHAHTSSSLFLESQSVRARPFQWFVQWEASFSGCRSMRSSSVYVAWYLERVKGVLSPVAWLTRLDHRRRESPSRFLHIANHNCDINVFDAWIKIWFLSYKDSCMLENSSLRYIYTTKWRKFVARVIQIRLSTDRQRRVSQLVRWNSSLCSFLLSVVWTCVRKLTRIKCFQI